VRTIEQQLADEIAYHMRIKGVTQTDFANHRGVSRQSVSPVFSGRGGLLTGTAKDLLEWLGVRIKLEPIEPPASTLERNDARRKRPTRQ
jgi:transcriptional regulator with XRE-family HTH domain